MQVLPSHWIGFIAFIHELSHESVVEQMVAFVKNAGRAWGARGSAQKGDLDEKSPELTFHRMHKIQHFNSAYLCLPMRPRPPGCKEMKITTWG